MMKKVHSVGRNYNLQRQTWWYM